MQKGKKGREEKKKGQKDKTSVMGGDKIGKKRKNERCDQHDEQLASK